MAAIGDTLVIWGGDAFEGSLGDGARLDLLQGVWKPISSKGQPAPRAPRFGVAGAELLVWGGSDPEGQLLNDAALYNPALDIWSSVPPAPFALQRDSLWVTAGEHGVFAYGEKSEAMKTWGGYFFDASTHQWKELPDEAAVGGRWDAVVAWSPSTQEVLIWGGSDAAGYRDSGVRFSIPEWKWRLMSAAGAPSARGGARGAVLPGTGASGKLVVFGGGTVTSGLASNTGGIYDLATDAWLPLPSDSCLPPPRQLHTTTVFGEGRSALVWGGMGNELLELPAEQGWVLTLDE